jgi:hypothetical protein
MRRPDEKPEDTGDREAERLKDFLKRKLPPGAPPEVLNPDYPGQEQEDTGTAEKSPPTKDPPKP